MRTGIQITRIGFFTLILCMFSIQAHAQLGPDEKVYYDNYQSILQIMEKGMEESIKTGDPSLDFLYEMIPHHQAAVSMSENVLKYSDNEQVNKIAATIIREQLEGIKKMEALKDKIKVSPEVNVQAEASYLKAYNNIYKTMIASMEDARPTGNIDKDFLEEMIPHHVGAIKWLEIS
ncbi:DUF305 domain-containing protein [Psychrobacillus sp. FSL K6-2684]|uniref:DUF305 domain-containing protein n=1 Tax=Psychrobacillus faecigallinarum TaxID=2762235 RepID=A0ABR8REB5_9BACI|nr:DUF305 domain-containing protein [Psychrobacillus faecigallinarum]MBD7946040.1 DUF305 domain-containing protein [Psychrobacillus faecigallinarum]